jgi:hypothetical protein
VIDVFCETASVLFKFSLDNCYFVKNNVSNRFLCSKYPTERCFGENVPLLLIFILDSCYFVKYAVSTGMDR